MTILAKEKPCRGKGFPSSEATFSRRSMLRVEVREINNGVDGKTGEIRWDGQCMTADPPESAVLQNIMHDPIYIWENGKKFELRPSNHPEQFLRSLYRCYCSPYLRCLKARTYPAGSGRRFLT